MPSSSDATRVQFLHPSGQANVRRQLETVLAEGTKSLRSAVCFFTEPGRVLLSDHIPRLRREESFFVACVAPPTNLTSLHRLHLAAPGHVYIHLGGTTPEEKKVGRAMMHSKVFLAEGAEGCRLWVGSHNLTAMAIEGGNYEAGVVVTGSASSGVMQDAIAHLQVCRNTAELFDPDQMERYEDIQRGWGKNEEWESERNVLVIHAQAPELPSKLPFILHINVLPTDLDRVFRMEGPARLGLSTRRWHAT